MADTMGSLIEDIEKRMTRLGYEDLEELSSPDHDIKSLKLLKRRLMDEEKAMKAEKKEKTKDIAVLRNFIVKVQRLFKKDMYIYNGKFIIPGEESNEDLKGKYILSISSEIEPTIKEILFGNDTGNSLLYIKDTDELKKVFDDIPDNKGVIKNTAIDRKCITFNISDDKKNTILHTIKDEMNSIQEDSNKYIVVDIDKEDPDIIGMKKMFSIQYKDFPPIDLNIQMFPYAIDKDTDRVEYMAGLLYEASGEMKLYYARIHIKYALFDIHLKITFF